MRMSKPFIINNLVRVFVLSLAVLFGAWLNEKTPKHSFLELHIEKQNVSNKDLGTDERNREKI